MARVFRLLIAVLGLTLLGYAGSVSAAPDCFQVAEKIKRLSLKDGLLEIKNATRQHLRSFKREGSSYEGQYDIACLIGQYMTLMDGTPSGLPGDETVRRYKDVRNWFAKRFKEDLAEYAKTVALYKNNSDLVEQEREEAYANSEFVLWSLAGSVNDAYRSMPDAEWNTSGLLDEVWCGDPMRAKAQFNQYRRKLPEESRKTNWSALSESEFERAQAVFRPAPNGLDALCGGADLIISSRDIAGLKSRYKKVARAEVKKSWITSLEKGAQLNQKNWNEIAWLGLSCTKAPTKQQYALFEALRWYDDNSINGKWWADAAQRKRAEALFNGQLERSRQRAGDACTELIGPEINQFAEIAKTWQNHYRKTVQKSLIGVWLNELKAQTLATKLSEFGGHVTLVTGASKVCASPSKSDRAAIQELKVFINISAGDGAAFPELTAVELFLAAKQSLPVVERAASQCEGIPQIQSFVVEFKQSRKKYESGARKQSAVVWDYATKGQYRSDLENLIRRIYPDALPSDDEKRAVAYLYDPKETIDRTLEQVLIDLSNRLSPLLGDANIYSQILDKQKQFAERWEGQILESWTDILSSKNCTVAESSILPRPSLTPQCSSPDEEDAQVLANYCRLKQIALSITKTKEREGNNEGAGGDSGGGDSGGGGAGGGGAGGGGALLLPTKPFWDHASAIQVASLDWGIGKEASYEELILEDPISAVVAAAGFSDVRRLKTALSQVSKNGDLEYLFKSKLQGCNSGRRYNREIRELKKLREFYVGAYETLCRDKELSNRSRHCDIARLLDRGGTKSKTVAETPEDSAPGSVAKKYFIEWRSQVTAGKDRVVVEVKSELGNPKKFDEPTSKDAITPIPEGALVQVTWYPARNSQDGRERKVFDCCDYSELKKEFRGIAEVTKMEDRYRITFLKDGSISLPDMPKVTSCTIYYPAKVDVRNGKSRSYILPRELEDIQIVDFYPTRKIVVERTGFKVEIGERIGQSPFVLGAIGEDFIVLLPIDSLAHFDLRNLFKSRRNSGLGLEIEFGHREIRDCRIR
jgi:hypothetical protein